MAKQLNVNLAVTANTQQAKQQLQQLQQTLSSLTTNSANLKIGLDQTQLQQASKQLLELQAHLKAATNVDTGALDFTKLNNSIRNSGKTLTQYGQQLLALGPQGKEAFAQLAQSVAQSEVPIRRLSGLLGQFGTVLKNTIRWQISSSLIHGFMGSIQQAYGYAQDLNKSLNNIQIVTGLSDNQMAKFAKTANTAAKALSTTTTKYTDAALIYYQQGIRNEKEIAERTNATIKMANVTGQTAETVSNQMTAIWNNFADGSKNLEYYADVITALGAATASSSEEISQGLQKFAAVADTVGLSYENATAALATITATTRQSADTVGTGLRTLFSRLQGLSLGQTLEDGVNLTKYSKALATVGVNALDAQGQLRNMDDVLNDLGNKWQSLSKAQQVALAQTVGGVRQYTTLVALMDNFDFYKQNLDVAKTSEGTLQKQQAIYEKSWEASSKRVKAAAETIYSSLINDQFFIKLNDGFAGFLDILNNIIAGLGGMKGLLLGIGGVMTNVFSGQIAQGMYNFGMGIRNLAQTPSRQREERAAFINNAAGLMAGGTYDAKTNTVTNVPKDNGPFSLVGQYTAMLQHQATFSGNAQYMTPQQKQMAQMALDNETKAYQDYQQKRLIQQQNLAAQQNRASTLINQVTLSDQPAFIEATKLVDTATALYNKKIDLINQTRENGTIDGLTQDDLISLFGVGFTANDIKNWTPEDLTTALNDAQRQASDDFAASRQAFVITAGRVGITQDRAEAYVNGQQALGQSNFDVSHSQRRAEQARKNAEETAGLSSKGLRAATGITNLAAGVMSGMAVSTQWDQMNKAIEQFKAGTLSTKDAVTQVTSSLAGMGMNGVMAFSSMTKAVQAFGVKSAAAAGWIGAALTVVTLLAPKAIAFFDTMHTTDAEIGEQLAAGVEQAEARATSAKQAYNDLINGFNNHSSLLDTLHSLTKGTIEFEQALLEANNAAYKLINDFNIGSENWSINSSTGEVVFSEEGRQELIRKQMAEVYQTAAESAAAKTTQAVFKRKQLVKTTTDLYKNIYETGSNEYELNKDIYQGEDARQAYYQNKWDTDIYKEHSMRVSRFKENEEYIQDIYDSYWEPFLLFDKLDAINAERHNKGRISKQDQAFWDEYQADYLKIYTNPELLQLYKNNVTNNKFKLPNLEDFIADYYNSGLFNNEILDLYMQDKHWLEEFGEGANADTSITKALWQSVTDELSKYMTEDFDPSTLDWSDLDEYAKQLGFESGKQLAERIGQSDFNLEKTAAIVTDVNQNKLTLTTARSATTKGTALQQSETLLIDVLSQNTKAWSDIYDSATKLDNGIDLTNEQVTKSEEEVSKLYLKYGGPEADKQLASIKSSLDYKNSDNKGEYLANKLAAYRVTEFAKDYFNKYYVDGESAIFTQLQKTQLDNWKSLNNTDLQTLGLAISQAAKTAGLTDESEIDIGSIIGQLGEQIQFNFIEAAQQAGLKWDNSELNKIAFENLEAAIALQQSFTTAYGEQTGNLVFSKIGTQLLTGSEQLKNIFQNFQFSGSTITDLANIKAGKTSLGTGELASEIYDSILNEIGEKGLFEELYNSEDFAEGLKSLRKELKKTGKIGADSLVALADQSELLSNYLEVSSTNVQGLADALNLLETGQIDNISNALLRALSAAGAVNSNLAQTYAYIDNFQEERSIQDIGAFMKKRADTVQAGFTSGMLLDAPLLQSMEALFGSDMRAAYQQDIYKWTGDQGEYKNLTPEQISKLVNDKYADQIAAMKSIQEHGNLSGMFEYYEQQNPNGGMFSYNKKTGQVTAIDREQLIKNGWQSQDAFIQGLQDNYGMSETMARAMASEYATTNGNIAQLWRETAATEGLATFTNGNETTINANDIRAFYDTYKDVLNDMNQQDLATALGLTDLQDFNGEIKNVDDLLKLVSKTTKDAKKQFLDLGEGFDFNTAKLTDLENAYNKSNEKYKNDQTFTEYLGINVITSKYIPKGERPAHREKIDPTLTNFDKVKQNLIDLGMSASQAYNYIDQMQERGDFSEMAQTIKTAAGSTKQLNSESAEYEQFLLDNSLEKGAAAWDQYVESQKKALENQDAINQQQQLISAAIQDAIQVLSDKGISIDGTVVFNYEDELVQGYEPPPKKGIVTYEVADDSKGSDNSNTGGTSSAAGYNNAGFAGGKHSNGQYEGMAEVGELGPELWIHDGQPYLAGVHGRTKAYIHPGDQIYTATQTQKILKDNPSLQDIPGFSVGYNQISWGTPSNADTSKNSTWEPERYHLITRQIKDLEREYERLSKIKDQAYGTNKLEAIKAEIAATQTLIEGQQALIDSTETYLRRDTEKLKSLLAPGEFELDEFGNIKNYDELQEKYKKKAKEDKDEEAQKVWDALEQYELTVDKFNEANTHMQELIYQEMDLRLETVTAKVDMKVNFDEREIKLLDHYIDRIDDNIYHTAEVLALTNQKLGNINQKINDTKEGIAGLFEELSDSEGNLIRKEDGSAYTMEEWLALSNEQRDMLNMNGKFGEQLEEYMDSLLDYIEELEKFKTKGVEEFGEAFSELNENVRSSIDLFDHYNQLLSNLKNIVDLQGVKLSAEMKEAMREIDAAMFSNTQNNIDAERENYKRLNSEVIDLRKKIAETQDETLKKQWEEQLKTAEEQLRTSESNMLSLWETGLQQAKDMFETALDDAATEYESTIAGMYGTVDELQKAWDQQKRNSEFYVKDFEKYYQISKLQRSITADLASQQKNGFKQSEGLKKLQDELNAARDNGVKLSSYDLDIYSKRYEYEKALMDLEDSRNAKSQVRLQRDANGNWGYVYTNNADEDDIIAKQQAVDDKLYELQKATQDRIANINDEMMSEITGVGQRLKELRSSGASQETIDKYLEQEKEYLNLYRQGLNKALEDAGMTVEDAKLRYGEEGFDILDQFQETLLSSITGNGDLDEFFDNVLNAMGTADSAMNAAGKEYSDNLDAINEWFNESGEDLATVIKGFASIINSESDTNLIDSKEQIQNAKDTFDEILQVATDFEKEFIKIYQPIIDENERLIGDLLAALHALNSEEYEGPNYSTGTSIADIIGNISNIGDTDTEIVEASHPSNEPDTKDEKPKKPLHLHTPKTETLEDLTERLKTTLFKPWSQVQIAKMDNGGYTGAWGDDGRLAILHEKEEVFNKDDTLRLLNAAEILRRIDLQANLMSKGISNFDAIDRGLMFNKANDLLEQMVTITAEFPNATNHSEIEEAFTNLINKASQYANRKGI